MEIFYIILIIKLLCCNFLMIAYRYLSDEAILTAILQIQISVVEQDKTNLAPLHYHYKKKNFIENQLIIIPQNYVLKFLVYFC